MRQSTCVSGLQEFLLLASIFICILSLSVCFSLCLFLPVPRPFPCAASSKQRNHCLLSFCQLCVCLCICVSRPQALPSNRLQITVNRCRRKVFKYFSASDELQLNLPPDEQKGGKVGGWRGVKLMEQRVKRRVASGVKGRRKKTH